MLTKEDYAFCSDYAISLEKFLSDNFQVQSYTQKKNGRNKKWRLKHDEISGWKNIISVPIPFAHRYKELVGMGKLIVVCDDYGKYKVYINPRIITESYALSELQVYYEKLKTKEDSLDEAMKNTIVMLEEKIADLEENVRIIRHFKGEDALEYVYNLIDVVDTSKDVMTRKRVENN